MMRERFRGARRTLAQRGAKTILLSLWRPDYAAALDLVPHHISCYHIDDEYTFSEIEQATDEREETLIRRVDQVFVTSLGLRDKKGHLNPNTLVVPNGVDYAAYVRTWPEPADLAAIPRPRVGYVGVIKKQLDLELLYSLAERHCRGRSCWWGPRSTMTTSERSSGSSLGFPTSTSWAPSR